MFDRVWIQRQFRLVFFLGVQVEDGIHCGIAKNFRDHRINQGQLGQPSWLGGVASNTRGRGLAEIARTTFTVSAEEGSTDRPSSATVDKY
jgi:hypothetical protein